MNDDSKNISMYMQVPIFRGSADISTTPTDTVVRTANDTVDNILGNFDNVLEPIKEVDAIDFITGIDFLCEDPTPFQRIVLKTLYNLWQKYSPDNDEQVIINILKNKWNITINFDNVDPVKYLVMTLGRRSTKSTTLSFIGSYAMYQLICKGHPQRYYGIRDRHRIYVTHIAASSRQAEEVFSFTKDNLRKAPFFRQYIDFDKDTASDLRLLTPRDLRENEAIRLRNQHRERGRLKESLLPGSLQVKSITTSAGSNRGDATYLLMFSELAHFKRAKFIEGMTDEQIASENPQSDYAIVKALSPSVRDFKDDGKIIYESSPLEKGGEFYKRYCMAGGYQQEDFESIVPAKHYQVIQLASWEARPTFVEEDFDDEFKSDPAGASMEYGALFGNPSGQFISESVINSIPDDSRGIIRINTGGFKFVVAIDPGGKGKTKDADTYAIGWGHAEGAHNPANTVYWIDGMHGFDADVKVLAGGRVERIPVDPDTVMVFLFDLLRDLGGRNFVNEIVYDQWENMAAISALQKTGYVAFETTFTPQYKSSMYSNFLQQAQNNRVKMYGVDHDGWVHRWKLEMKYLQRIIRGAHVSYQHPTSGPVRHDDFSDVTANCVYRLDLRVNPTRESIKKTRKQSGQPTKQTRVVTPVYAPSLTGAIGGGTNIDKVVSKLADRGVLRSTSKFGNVRNVRRIK